MYFQVKVCRFEVLRQKQEMIPKIIEKLEKRNFQCKLEKFHYFFIKPLLSPLFIYENRTKPQHKFNIKNQIIFSVII